MPAFCDEDGYDSPHQDQLKICFGASAYMLTYPVYYHDKNQEVWLTLNPRCYGKYAKRHLSEVVSQNGCHYAWQLRLTTTSIPFGWQSSFKHQNSRTCSFQNYILSQNTPKQVSTGFLRGGHICDDFLRRPTGCYCSFHSNTVTVLISKYLLLLILTTQTAPSRDPTYPGALSSLDHMAVILNIRKCTKPALYTLFAFIKGCKFINASLFLPSSSVI